jgi:hypothetical protein
VRLNIGFMSKKKQDAVRGQPTKYDPKYADEIVEYFARPVYIEKEKDVITKSGDVIKVTENEATDFPSFAGFAAKIRVHRETLIEWCKAHKEFDWAYKYCKALQENWIVVNGNRGHLQANFAIFTTKNLLGWRDKQPDENDQVNINLNLAEKMAKARARVGGKS